MKTAWIKSLLTHLLPLGVRLLPCVAIVLLAEAARAESITVTAETIGINFARSDAAMSSESTTSYGFAALGKGGLLEENKWQGFYADNSNNPMTVGQAYTITTTGNPGLNITLKKNSTNNVWGPNATNKLFGSYLDNGSSLLFEGMPRSGYDVAILFSGDGGNYSPVTVNGTTWTYNAEGALVEGTTPWGDRSTISDASVTSLDVTGTSTTGRVMFLENLTSQRLSIETVNNNGRGTIAGIQLYLRAGTYEPLNFEAAPTGTSITFSEIDWSGKTFVASEDTIATLTLPAGATLDLDEAPALVLLKLRCEGEANIVASGSGSLANVKAIEVESGTIDFGALQISKLKILANAVAAVQARDQITTLERLGALKYSGGTAFENYDLSAEPNGSTTIIGKTITSVTDRASSANRGEGFFSVNGSRTLKVVDGGDVTVATRFAMADDGESNPIFEMDGGTITVQGTGVNNGATAGTAVIIGHWGGAPTVNLKRGLLDVSEGGVMIGWTGAPNVTVGTDLNDSLNVAGSAVLRAKLLTSHEAWGQNAGGSLVVNPSGVIELGSGGLVLGQYKAEFTVTLAGGEIKAVDNASITYHANVRNPLAVTASSTLSADSDKTLTVSAPLTIANGATLTSKGNVVFVTTPTNNGAIAVASGTITITAGAEGVVSLASGATLNLILTEALKTSGYTASGVTGEGSVKFFDVDGTAITTGVSGNTYTPPTPRWTATSTSGDWNDLSLWSNTTSVPTSGNVVLDFSNVNADTTITIDASATLDAISIVGASGELTFEASGSNALTVSSISVLANADVTSGVILTTDGTVSIAADATLTVPNNFVYSDNAFSVANNGLPSRVTGPGTLALNLGVNTTVNMTGSNPGYKLGIEVVSGTLNFPNGGGDGPGKGRLITVSGHDSTLKFATGDAGGWNYADGQKVALYEEGTLLVTARDTFVADLEMLGGTLLLSECASGGRGLDLYHANVFTVLAATNATAEMPTESTFTFTSATGAPGRKVLIRNGDVTFDVKANARLTVDVTLVAGEAGLNAGGTPGKLIKTGLGELLLTAANTYNTGSEIRAGVVTLTDAGKFGSGTVNVAANAVVNVNVASGATKSLSDYGSFSADAASILRKSGAGRLTIDAAYTGKLEVLGGTLALGMKRDMTLSALAEGCTIELTRASGEQSIVIPTTLTAAPATSAFLVNGSAPGSVEIVDGRLTIHPVASTYYWVPAGNNTNWSTPANWRMGSATGSAVATAPGELADVVVPVAKGGSVTMTMDANKTILSMVVEGVGEGTTNGLLTIDGTGTLSAVSLSVTDANVETSGMVVPTVAIANGAQIKATLAEGVTWTMNRLSGAGSFIKEGAGTVQFAVATEDARVVAEDAAIVVNDGILQTWLYGNDGNPILKNVHLTFGADADGFRSHGWLGLDGTVTVNTVADIVFAAANGTTPSLQGAGTLVKQGAGAFAWDLRGNNAHANPIVIEAGAVKLQGSGTQTGVISGAGQLKIAENATITLSAQNSYTGGTDVVATSTLTATNAASLGTTGAITGAGTIVYSEVFPGNVTGLTAATWTGTVKIQNATGSAAKGAAELNLDTYGSANSLIVLESVTGWVANNTVVSNLRLEADGLTFNNGSSGSQATVTVNQLTGSGAFKGAIGSVNAPWKYCLLVKRLDDEQGNTFSGSVDLTTQTSAQTSFVVGTNAAMSEAGKIVIDGAATVANGATWAAVNGITATANAVLSGTGSLGGAVSIAEGATFDVTNGTLTIATLNALPSAITVKTADVLTTMSDRVAVATVTEDVVAFSDVVVTLQSSTGQNLGTNYRLTSTTNEEGATVLQVMLAVEANTYTINMVEDGIASLSEALAAGVFGDGIDMLPEETINLVINFGDVADGAEANPGIFDLDNDTELQINTLTITGTNGGMVTHSTDVDVVVAMATVTANVNVTTTPALANAMLDIELATGAIWTLAVADNLGDCVVASKMVGEGALVVALAEEAEGTGTTVVFSGANTYTGGTTIAANTIVKMSTASALGTGAIDGEGTLYYVPAMTGTTPATPTLATTWAGTLILSDIEQFTNMNLKAFGTDNSTIGLKNVGAATTNNYLNEPQTIASKINLLGDFSISNGNGGWNVVFANAITGSGTFLFRQGNTGTPADAYYFTGDLSGYTGTLRFLGPATRRIVLGSANESDEVANQITIAGAVTWNGTMEAAGTIKVTENGVLGGEGTLSGAVAFAENATLKASATKALTLAAGATLSLPSTLNVVFDEGTPLAMGTPIVVLNRVDTSALSIAGTTAIVKIGNTVVEDAVLAVSATGDLVVQIPAAFEAVVPAGETAWDDLVWTVNGETVETVPGVMDNVILQPESADAVVTCTTAPLAVRALEATAPVAVRFTRDCVTQEIYESIPTTVTLVTTEAGLDEAVAVQLASLKYGAMATVAQTATSAVASLTLPDSALISETQVISISFAKEAGHQIGATEVTGLAGYETIGSNWVLATGGNLSRTDVDLFMVPLSKTQQADAVQTELAGALSYSRSNNDGHNGYYYALSSAFPVLKGYIDDKSSNSVTITLPAEKAAEGYTVILYASTDSSNKAFAHYTVNDVNYTAVNGKTVEGNATWGTSGAANGSADVLAEGTNVLVITNQTSETLTIAEHGDGSGARGGIAGVQVVLGKTEYNLVSSVTATVSAATADTVVAWTDLTWVDDDGAPATAPTANTPATIVFESDATLDIMGATAQQVQVVGYNHRVRFVPESIPATVPFVFSEDTLYRLTSANDTLPENTLRTPGTLRYEYAYDASTTPYVTVADTTSDFVAGFTGTFTANGGNIRFSEGVVSLTRVAGTAQQTGIVFAGTSRTTVADLMAIGEAEVVLCDTASVSTVRLSLSDGQPNYTTSLTLEDSARLTVTGNTNVDANDASIMIGHWNGPSTLTLRDNAKLIAESTDMLVGKTGNAQTITLEGGEMRVRGIKLSANASGTNTLNLDGGKLLVGKTGIARYGSTTLTMNCNGGSVGALADTVTFGADVAAAIGTLNGTPVFESTANATLVLAQDEPFLATGVISNRAGTLQVGDTTLTTLTVEGGILKVAGTVNVATLTAEPAAKITFDGGLVIADACDFTDNVTVEIPLTNRLSDGGYIQMRNGAALPNLSGTILSLVLEATRADADKVLPEVPVVLGTYAEGDEPTVKGFGLINNTNNAIAESELVLQQGDLGAGLYVLLTGNEVLKRHDVELNQTAAGTGYTLTQTVADAYPYYYFTATVEGARLVVPAAGVAVSHPTFSGATTRIVVSGDKMVTPLVANHVSIATNLIFDLSAWEAELPNFVRGAVRDVPVSFCLMSGGVTQAAGVTYAVALGSFELPAGFTSSVEATQDGLYWVVSADRPAHTVSVNFTNAATPLVAPPAKAGVYPTAVSAWNDLNAVYSSANLKVTDFGGEPSSTAKAVDGSDNTRLLVYTSKVNTLASAPTSMLKVWLSDSTEQTLTVQNVPFEAYRVALIFANDLEAAAYAPIQVGEGTYAMDGEGYTRRDITTYTVKHATTGLVTLEVAGDEAWGSTDLPEAAEPVVTGVNALVTDVLTASEVKITLPAAVYGRRYAGLAALQIVEAPVVEAVAEPATFAYTFTADGDYALADLDLTSEEGTTAWVSATQHNLTLTSDYDVTVTLPLDFVADSITLAGSGKVTLKMENNGGALLNRLDASALAGDLTMHIACVDVEFSAPTGVTTFEKAFNNNGQPYIIAAGATLVLGETFPSTTNMEPDLFATATVDLTIAAESQGTLRRNYAVTQNRPGQHGYAWDITLAYKDAIFGSDAYWQPSLLVEEGDNIVVNGNNVWVTGDTTRRTFTYRQTGGSFVMGDTTNNNNGFLCSPAGNSALVNGQFLISGGRLHTSAILAWDAQAQVTVDVTNTGRLELWNKFHAQSGASLTATFSQGGTLELAGTALAKGGDGSVSVTVADGVITTAQTTASLNLPVAFTGTESAPTVLAPEEGCTLVLNAANTGSGAIEVTSGTVAIANAGALASTSTTVKSGATFEARGFTAENAMTNTVTFEAGSVLSATAADGISTVRIAGRLVMPADQTAVQYRLNGELYDGVTVDAENGMVTFMTKVTVTAVTWDAAQGEGLWADGVAGPWVDGATYYNGAAVTFVNATPAKVDVTVQGNVAPGLITWGGSSADTYRFNAASNLAMLTLTGTTLDMGSGQVYNVPVATAVNANLTGASNTYRLIGALSNGRKASSLVTATDTVINTDTTQAGIWCTDGVTLAPQAGEVMTLSAMGYAGDTTHTSHLSGSGNVTITGGGKVVFAGRVLETATNSVAYQNKAFSGQIIIQDGSTLDITMTRDRNDSRPRDDQAFFALPASGNQDVAGAPLWTGETVGIRVLNGATFRVSGCRNLFGGWANRNDANLLAARPLEIGTNATAEFAFSALQQVFPHGFRFTGSGATLRATQNMYVSGGTTIEVAGIGDKGDRADPATDTAVDADGNPVNADTYNTLTAGIVAEIASGDTTGLVSWSQASTANDPLILSVGEGSTLNISANLLNTNEGAARSNHTFNKVGMGAVRFMQSIVDTETVINVTEGVFGGTATFTAPGTTVTAAAGTVVEAGLSIPVLNLADEVILAINPTGETLLHAGRLSFTSSGHYTIASILPESEIPEAEGLPPMKVVSWNAMRAADTAVFTLDDALTAKGYGLELRADGLYLMKQVTYVRELDIAEAGTYRVIWDANNAWYRLDDPATLRNYDANEDEAVTALFLLPETFAAENVTLPVIQLILTREVSFANVRFAVPVEVEGEVTFKTLPVTVVYEYNLINETMPTADSAVRFTWVPTLVVMRDGNPGLATLQVSVPNGYEYTISNTTVMVYASAAAPALNINFTDGIAGDASWVSSTADPCGVVPFAGVYWNNASTTSGNLSAIDGNHSVMNVVALPAGVEADANGQVATCEVTYAFKQPTSIASRMAGNADAALVSSFLAGNSAAALSETIRIAGNMTNAGTQNGWQVRVASVPFEAYDLYLVLAGNTDDTVTYPAIRIKVGEGDWRTFSMVNGWAAPAAQASTWQGEGGLVKGEFIDGRNVLHIRVQSAAGSALEIAPWDNGQANAAAASSVGLAALQIVRCDDGAMMERLGDGKWSDAGGWRRTLFGGTETGAWIDSTAEAPRYASIPMVQSLTADRVAAVPYLALTGSGSMLLKGSDAMISTGTLDLTQVDASASLTFGADVFAEPINVLLAPDVTVCVPENDSGTVINRWFWLNDDAARDMNSTSATIQKKLSGDVVFVNPLPYNLQIDDGTLWLASNNNTTSAGTVAGAGTFGKKGTGTLTHSGNFNLSGSTPLRVSEGTLALTKALTGISGGSTVLVDGGTLEMPVAGGFTSGTLVYVDRGTLIVKGTQRNNRPNVRLVNGATLSRPQGDGGWQGYQLESLLFEGANNVVQLTSAGSGGPCVDVIGTFRVLPGATVTIEGNGGALRVCGGIVDVQDGAVLTSKWRMGRGNADGYGSEADVLTKTGAGRWRIERVLSPKGDSTWGQTFVVAEGEASFAFGGGNYGVERTAPITVQAGAKMSGNVVFTDKTAVVFEEGAIVRNGVSGVATSKLAFHTVTFNKDMVFEMDLRNTTALTVTNTATFMPGEMTVRLLNMGDAFTGEKQLIAWPTTVSVPSTFTSPEAMALDAVLEKRNDGLYLVASNASYVWANQSGVWSQENGWFYQEAAASYPEIANVADPTTPVARLVASEEDVTLALDKGTADVDGVAWKAQSLVTAVSANRTLILNQGASLLASAYAGLNTVVAWADIWKLGEGEAIFNAPVQFRNAGTGASLNVAAGTLTLTHPLTTTAPATGTSPIEIPAAVEVAKGATLVYDLSATQELLNTINGKYNPLAQTFTGAIAGEGTLRVKGVNNAITLTSTTDNDLNLDVQAGSLTLNGDVARGATRSTRRTVTVAKGATLALASENALGGSSNIEWSLAADATQGAVVTTTADARVRGQVNVIAAAADEQATATLGTLMAQLDGALRLNVPANTVLAMGGEWTTPADAALTTALTKVGAGRLTLSDFAANVPVTVSAGEVRLGAGAVQTVNDNEGATTPNWTVAPGAVLTLGGGKFTLVNGRLTTQPGAILNGGVAVTEVDNVVELSDRTIFAFGETSNINVGRIDFKQEVTVLGVVTVNLDALSPTELVGKTSVTLMTFENRSGSGSFQLGGNKLVAWAEEGWTLRDNGSEVILQHFGGDTGYYTWAGDGSAGSTGAGNWANAFWVDSATNTLGDWPTATDVSPSVKLQDTDPLTGEEIPEEARTLDWTLPAQTIASFYAKNSEGVDYKLISSSGSAAFEVSGDFLKAGAGKLTVERPLILAKKGSLRILGGETEFTGAVSASSGEFDKPITLAGENTLLRFSGTPSRALMGLLEGDGQATLTHSGTGTLTLGDSVDKLKALNVEAGHVRLTADGQYVVVPTMTVAEGATLTYGGTLAGAGAVQMQINADAAQAGTLVWNATTASASDKAPRLAAVPGVAGAAVKVNTFRYNPNAGHLILDPNADVLAPGFKLEMMASDEVTAALWLGAQATAGDALTVSALTGEGVIGVEPIVELVSDDTWSTHRVLTVEPTATSPAEVTAFEGSFMGATTPDNTDIRIGLAVQNPNGGDRTYFRYMGNSTHALLGSLTVGADAAAEVTGTWAGDIAVAANGLLMGNGVIGATDRTISVPKGAIISGATYGKRVNANNTFTTEVIPAELTVKGTLSLETGSVINTLIRKNEKGNTWASAITVDNLLLPTVLEDGEEEVKLTVNVDLELGAVVSNIKVLGWTSLNGGQKINGTVKVTSNGQEIPGYFLKKKSDGLYLSRESARFWMILH